jgi:putative phosphoesterase
MLIGILSDSHGRAEITGRAVRGLRERGAEMLLHLGDVGTEAVIDELVGHDARLVLGNCDFPPAPLRRYATYLGIAVDDPMGRLEVGGRRIAFTHGHLDHLMEQALAEGVDYLLHGHTHEARDERIGRTRVINPGALHRAARYTAAILDPAAGRVELLTFSKQP